KIDDHEKLRPEELNQQNIEALVAESNLKMEILPVNDLDIALHDFVNKDDKMAFYSCVQYNLDETRKKLNSEAEKLKIEEEDLIVKVGECIQAYHFLLQERVKERSLHSKEHLRRMSDSQTLEGNKGKASATFSATNSFSDDEDTREMLSTSKSVGQSRKEPSRISGISKRGRGRGSSNLKQMTLDATIITRRSQRSTSVSASAAIQSIAEDGLDSPSSEETQKFNVNEVVESSEPEESFQVKGRKRAAPRGRGRGSTTSAKRGRKSNSSSMHSMLMNIDNDDDDDDDLPDKQKKVQPPVAKNYGALRKR
ncbi:DNA double-strand break repair protein Mre11 protein, partial [Dioscorea alata]